MKLNFPIFIAKRYFFPKKSYNTTHLICFITTVGIVLAVMTTVCILSVFNGFDELMKQMFNVFDPELKILSTSGKVFVPTTNELISLYRISEIETVVESLEEQILLVGEKCQAPVTMKGVSDHFKKIISKYRILTEGKFQLIKNGNPCAIFGIGVASIMGINTNYTFPLRIFIPKRINKSNFFFNPMSAFNQNSVTISGIFMTNHSLYDENYIIVSIDLARQLLNYQNEVSALEINLKHLSNVFSVKKRIKKIFGNKYLVKDQYEQQQVSFSIIQIEKWITFFLLCFILAIFIFNLFGALTMLIAEKQKDLYIFYSFGASIKQIAHIFILVGWIIIIISCVIGILLGILLCFGQQYFKWLSFGNVQSTFNTNAYPIKVEVIDILWIILIIGILGYVAILYPVKYKIKNKKIN